MAQLRGTALIVHRQAGVRRLIAAMLRPQGFAVLEADSAEAAIAAMGTHPVAVLVCEATLPGMSGQELVAAVRASTPQVRCILTSAYGKPPRGPEDVFLQEPFALEELVDAVVPAPGERWQSAVARVPAPRAAG